TVPLGSPEGIPDSLTSSPAPENQIASVLLGRKEIRQMDVAYELAFNHEMADRAQEWSRTDSFRLDECRAYVRNRNPAQLIELVMKCGNSREQLTVRQEPEGVNLFLHISEA